MTESAPATRQASEAGFSLVEMLVVLSILALVAALFFPSLQGRREPTALATARQIVALLQKARTNAIARGRREEVQIDLRDGTVRYGNSRIVTIPQSLDRRLLVGRELVTADSTATLLFLPDGGSSGAEFTLRGRQGKPASVMVPWLTGVPVLRPMR